MQRDPLLGVLESTGVFTNWNLPTDERLRLAKEAGFNTLIIGVPAVDPMAIAFRCPWAVSRIDERIDATRQAGLLPVLMPWAIRHRLWLESALPFFRDFQDRKNILTLLDAEPSKTVPNWHVGQVSPEDAADLVNAGLGGRFGMTGLADLHFTLAPLVRLARINVPQAYSIWKDAPTHWSHSDSTFPGHQQLEAYKSWAKVAKPESIVMGLGCYWADRPDVGPGVPAIDERVNMVACVGMTISVGCDAAWFWALEHLAQPKNECRSFFGL